MSWATSVEYAELVAQEYGWGNVPPGTRLSLYENQDNLDTAPYADLVLQSILNADPQDPTVEPVPYTGIQYVAVPEFQSLGTAVGNQVAEALAGEITVAESLENSQWVTEQIPWAFSIVLYTVLAARMGAAEPYPEAQAEEDLQQERIRQFQDLQDQEEDLTGLKDRTLLTRLALVAAVIALAVIFVFGWRVLFNSPDLFTYYVNRDRFYSVALWGSLIHFALALFAQQRSAGVVKAMAAGRTGPPADRTSVSVRGTGGSATRAPRGDVRRVRPDR